MTERMSATIAAEVRIRCAGSTPAGQPCRAWPLRDERYCLWHIPEPEPEAAEARRLGGNVITATATR